MMTKYKIRYFISLFLPLVLGSTILTAQPGRFEERLKEQRIAFFTERMDLNPEEAKLFWPLYEDYSNRRDRLNSENRNLFHYVYRNIDNLSDKEVEESMEKYVSFKEEEQELFLDYHKQFLEILPERKVMMLYIAEAQFKQYILNQIRQGRGRAGAGRGRE